MMINTKKKIRQGREEDKREVAMLDRVARERHHIRGAIRRKRPERREEADLVHIIEEGTPF